MWPVLLLIYDNLKWQLAWMMDKCSLGASVNDPSRVVRMTIIGDATASSVTSDDSRGHLVIFL